ncbi:hypothetical protein ACFO3I_13630 [Rheinheimera marina]|uniref:Integrase n=1 Tax=Rheinheimera marina TaxID=1774958 RepID=A0ABV9JPC9_9GAMM
MSGKKFQLLPKEIEPIAPALTSTHSQPQIAINSLPTSTIVKFPENNSTLRNFDFCRFYGKGFNEIVFACQHTIEHLLSESISTHQSSLSIVSIAGYCYIGARNLFDFCSLLHASVKNDITLSSVTPKYIIEYIQYIKGLTLAPASQKTSYTLTKSLLIACHRAGYLPDVDIKTLFPRNPFPHSNKQMKGERPLSQHEKRYLVLALKSEMSRILSSDMPLSSYDLAVCVLAIGISTGMNPTPVLSLPIDCLQPHPLKANLRLLVAFKRRGNSTHLVSLRQSEDIALLQSVKLNVANTIDMLIERNAALRMHYSNPNHLLVYQSESGGNYGAVRPLRLNTLWMSIQNLIEKHALKDDDGRSMKLSMMRLRKTYINRIWELSGQDPLITARHGKHNPDTANKHYWEAPPEAERNMRFIGETRIKQLLDVTHIPADRTAIARCTDPRYGHLAPKNGTVCMDVLNCFRCKSFVVTEDDLYRLYSFYWAVVNERGSFGAKRWEKYLRHIIRIIDNDIGPQFDTGRVNAAREQAKTSPHPFWRSLDMVRLTQ